MERDVEVQIVHAEEKLRQAMLTSDINALDQLLAPNLIFTNHLGERLTKSDDISAHESGLLRISILEPSEQQILLLNHSAAVVSVRVQMTGLYAGEPAEGAFRFTRVWAQTAANWQVVAAHATIVT